MRAHDLWRRGVHQVPVVDPIGAPKVQPVDALLSRDIRAAVSVRQQNHREQPGFVPARVEELLDLLERQVAKLARESPDLWHREAEKSVARAVLARTGFEEALGVRRA